MKQKIAYSIGIALFITIVSYFISYGCGFWDGVDTSSGRPIGGQLACRGVPLTMVRQMGTSNVVFFQNIIINYLLFSIVGFGLLSVWKKIKKN